MAITLWHSLGGTPSTVLEQIVNRYNESHVENPAQLVFVDPKDYASSAKNALESLQKPVEERGNLPQIVFAPEYMTGDMLKAIDKGHVISASTLLEPEKKEEIAELVLRTFGQHCLPFNPACGVLYINSSLLELVGEDAHWKPQSLEDLDLMSQKIIGSGLVENGYTCAWPEAYLAEVVLAQINKPLVTSEGAYNFSQLSDHIFDMWKFVQNKTFLPPATGNYDPTRDFFLNRKVAFYMQGSGHYALLESKAKEMGFKINYAPLPTLSKGQKEKYAFPLGGSALWVINDETTQKMIKGVRDFINYFASQEVQEYWHKETAYVPVNKTTPERLKEFYSTHPLHAAVVEQTIQAKVGDNSFGIKKEGYREVRIKLYPLIRSLVTLEGSEEEVKKIIQSELAAFDKKSSS